MSPELIETSAQANDNANYALRTYYNYVRAWIIEFERQHGSFPDGIDAFVSAVRDSADLSLIQGEYTVSDNLRNSYNRGRLTWQEIQNLPIVEYPELAISANYWLPVQAYYAIHGFGIACLIVLNQAPRLTHTGFRKNFSELVHTYFPPPFCGQCIGGPTKEDYSYPGLATNAVAVIAQSNLQTPMLTNAKELAGKALSTTRQEAINERFMQKRKDLKKTKLFRTEKCGICETIPATSICDFLYRMRVRSNYESPDMYIYTDPGEASNHFKDLRYLTKVVIAGLQTIIEGRLGPDRVNQL